MCAELVVPHFTCNGPMQLWKFLLGLLMDRTCENLISWTGNGWEFKLNNPIEVSRRWGDMKNKPNMNYEKLARAMRYYYKDGPIQKAVGKKYVYRFVDNVHILNSIGMTLEELYDLTMM